MSVAIADTGPIHYLILINSVQILPHLFESVILPNAVLAELSHPNAPSEVSTWARQLPDWVSAAAPVLLEGHAKLGAGEREAIAMAQMTADAVVLLDEREARGIATSLGLRVMGTLGIIERASTLRLLDLNDSIRRLLHTSFRIEPQLIRRLLSAGSSDAGGHEP